MMRWVNRIVRFPGLPVKGWKWFDWLGLAADLLWIGLMVYVAVVW